MTLPRLSKTEKDWKERTIKRIARKAPTRRSNFFIRVFSMNLWLQNAQCTQDSDELFNIL
jgi:hypothetical protein